MVCHHGPERLAGMAALVHWRVASLAGGRADARCGGRRWGVRRADVGCSARVMRVVAAARAMVPARITSTVHSGSPGTVAVGGGGGGPGGGSGGAGVAEAAGAMAATAAKDSGSAARMVNARRAAGGGRRGWRAPGRGC